MSYVLCLMSEGVSLLTAVTGLSVQIQSLPAAVWQA